MSHLATLLLCALGFMALAMAMERHQEALFGRAMVPATARRLRVAGWAALLLALVVIVGAQGWALGLVSYSGHASLGAALVFGALIMLARRRAQP